MVTPEQFEQNQNVQAGPQQIQFSGGWQPNMYPQVAQEGTVRDMLNFELATQFPQPRKTKGYAAWNTAGTQISGQAPIIWMDMLYGGKKEQDYLFALREDGADTGNTNLWAAERTGKSPAIVDSKESVNAVEAATFQIGSTMWMYMVGAASVKSDGSLVHPVGNISPSVGFTLKDDGTGSIDGKTKVRVSYVYGDHGESNAGDSVSLTLSSGNIKITSLPIASSTLVTQRKIYRTDERTFKGRSGEDYWLADTIKDNTTSTTTLTAKGDVIIANQAMPQDNSQPPDAQIIERYANRMFYAGGSITPGRIIYSKSLKPDQYEDPDNSDQPTVIDAVRGEDQIIMAMAGARTKLFILTPQSVWLLNGRTPANWSFNKVHSTGTRSPDSVKVINGVCYFVGSDLENVYRTDGRKLQPIGDPISNYLARAQWNAADQFWAIHDTKKDTYRLHIRHRDHGPGGPAGPVDNKTGRMRLLIDDFEDGDISNYSKDDGSGDTTTTWSTVGSPVQAGSKALQAKFTAKTSLPHNASFIASSGLPEFPEAGERFAGWVRCDTNDSTINVGMAYAKQDKTFLGNGYKIEIVMDATNVQFSKDGNGGNKIGDATEKFVKDTWYKLVVDWKKNGTHKVQVYKQDGTRIADVSTSDTKYNSGNFGFSCSGLNLNEKCFFDEVYRTG